MSELTGHLTPPPGDDSAAAAGGNPPIRMYDLMAMLEDNLRQMNQAELRGALLILGPMTAYLDRIYFEEQRAFDRKSLVKTIEELFEIGMEVSIHRSRDPNDAGSEDSE
jgi:hypothetical protein